jgi:hypothetical protein
MLTRQGLHKCLIQQPALSSRLLAGQFSFSLRGKNTVAFRGELHMADYLCRGLGCKVFKCERVHQQVANRAWKFVRVFD